MAEQIDASLEGRFLAAGALPHPGVRRQFLEGGISLGLAVAIQRIFAFISTALAARIGGVSVLGEYSIAHSTAGMVGAFVGTGVGTVALRYAGQFPRTTHAYRKVLRLIGLITCVAGVSAGAVMLLGSRPLARLVLNNAKLSTTLKFAAGVLVVIVLFEALNGVLIALHNFRSLLWLSVISGAIMVVTVPLASQFGAKLMLVSYAFALLAGIVTAFLRARSDIKPLIANSDSQPIPPRAREIILFGNTQQFNMIVTSIASWWIVLLITRQDPSFHQMGFYFVGSQLRQLAGQAPTLASQLVFPMLSRMSTLAEQHDRVLSITTFFCAALSFVPAGLMVIALPLVLKLYGVAYSQALITCIVLIATAVVQLTYVPVANALMMSSLRASALLSGLWSLSLVLLGYALVADYGATGAALAWLLSQLISQIILLCLMKRIDRLPAGTITTWCLADLGVLSLAGLAILRALVPGMSLGITVVQTLVFGGLLFVFLRVSQKRGYLPNDSKSLLALFKAGPRFVMSTLVGAKPPQSQRSIGSD